MKKALLTGFLLLLAAASRAEAPEFYLGVCTHFAQNKGDAASNLDLAAQAGVTSIRDEVSWSSVEKEKGVLKIPDSFGVYLDEAVKRGIRPLILLNYSNPFYDKGNYPVSPEAVEGFARYCEAVIRYAGDRVKLYQIWNEWDGGCGMSYLGFGRGTAAGYVRMLKEVYPRLKKLAPDAVFIANSVCTGETFLEETFKQGVLEYCDAIAFHPYNYNGADNTAEAWFERMKRLRELMKRYPKGEDKPLYITEIGWPNQVNKTGSTEQESAVKLARLYLYGRMLPHLKGIWWYDFQDDGWDYKHHENNFGLVRPDLTPKAPFFAMKSLASRLSRARLLSTETLDGGYLLRFDGFWAVINHSGSSDLQLVLESSVPETPLSIEVIGSAPVTRPWGYRDWPKRQAKANPNQIAVLAGEMPLLLTGDLAKVKVAAVRKYAFPRADRPQQSRLQLPRLFAEVAKEGGKSVATSFRGFQKLGKQEYRGAEDLAAAFECSYDRDNLYLAVTVTDDVFHQTETDIANAWRGDSLQLAFQLPDSESAARTELDAALIGGKALTLVREAQGDRSKTPASVIDRNGRTTVYRLTIPAPLLGVKAFEEGMLLTAAFLVNDNDGDGRKGFLAWGEGIGIGKNPSLYNLLIFK